MTREKQSFFEKLTGARTQGEAPVEAMPIYAEDEEVSMPMNNTTPSTTATPEFSAAPAWAAPAEQAQNDGEGQLTIDVFQTENDLIIKSTIAGVKPEDLDVDINNDMIMIRGERKQEESIAGENYYYQECYWGVFSRSVVLPVDVIADKAEASMKNGILTIKLPKADTNKTKKIQVRGF